MKKIIPILWICIAIAGITACKRDKASSPSLPPCATCYDAVIGYERDTDGVYFYVPTAFTPNGDGKNDLLRMVYANLDINNSGITIWDAAGRQLFSGDITQPWTGRDSTGVVYPAGRYPAQVKVKTIKGKIYDICGCITILQYTGNCIKVNAKDYFFEDQINPDSAYIYPTSEVICP